MLDVVTPLQIITSRSQGMAMLGRGVQSLKKIYRERVQDDIVISDEDRVCPRGILS